MSSDANNVSLQPSTFSLLARLWLHEPDAATLARAAAELDLIPADPTELGPAYADLFLLNVYPYGTAFTDPSGELNAPAAHDLAALYGAHGYDPPELAEVAAPDHLGLCLGFLEHLREKRIEIGDYLVRLAEWAPICCLAVEREPTAHAFHRALALHTRETLFAQFAARNSPFTTPPSPLPDLQSPISTYHSPIATLSPDQLPLTDLLRFWLTPAVCGIFLSRSRLGRIANDLGLSLPFGPRFEVARWLFAAAGEMDVLTQLIAALASEVALWRDTYRRWSEAYPAWQPIGKEWQARTEQAGQQLSRMREAVQAAS